MTEQSQSPRVCDRLVKTLHAAGVRHLFSLSGNQIMPIYDALIDSPIELIHTRHEAAAVFMAEAAARSTGEISVALVTAGPGFGNALGALYSASMSETPLLLLSGDSPRNLDGQGAFQEFDQVAAATPFVKASLRATAEVDIADVLCMGINIARDSVPGPVHVALPADVLVAESDSSSDPAYLLEQGEIAMVRPTEDRVSAIVSRLREARRPVILTGPQMTTPANRELLLKIRHGINVPVVILDSPRGLRDPAKGAMRSLLGASDCVLYLGKPVDFTSGFGAMDVMPAEQVIFVSDRQSTLEHAISVFGDRLKVVERMSTVALARALVEHSGQSPSGTARQTWLSQAETALSHRALNQPTDSDRASEQFARVLSAHIDRLDQPTVICDGGEIGQWAQAFIDHDNVITNGPSGAIGGSLPYAVGAAIARPKSPAVAVMGDGTVGFHIGELETASRYDANITIVIGNDSRWNAEHHLQINQYGPDRTMGCELGDQLRYDLVADALGCSGHLVRDIDQLPEVLARCASTPGPHCVNVLIPGAAAPSYTTHSIPNLDD